MGVKLANCTQKAQGVLNVLKRNIIKYTTVTKETICKEMVRLHVECARCAWHPYQNNHIYKGGGEFTQS